MFSRASRARAALQAALLAAGCGGLGGQPPARPPVVQGLDGTSYYLVDRGAYRGFYDARGRLDHITYDSNGDGRPDRITRHRGSKQPRRIEVDVDLDGRFDRWEEADPVSGLVRFALLGEGYKLGGDYHPNLWTVVGPDGDHRRYEYDKDGDGRFERVEVVEKGRIGRIELDTDRDGRLDRWQDWTSGRLLSETVDTDQDGRPDLRLRFGPKGGIAGIDKLSP